MPRPAGTYHVPAMTAEVLELLRPQGGGLWVDGMVGGGGHARLICDRLSGDAVLLAIDRDPAAIQAAGEALAGVRCRVILRRAHFEDVGAIVDEIGVPVAGAICDVGLSSDQLDRGAGFSTDDISAPLDMRQGPDQDLTAARFANDLSEKDLADLIYRNSDEKLSRRIAASIVRLRPLVTMGDLVNAVLRATPRGYRYRDETIRRVAMALRVAVGRDIEQLETGLADVIDRMAPGARVAVLCWQSHEEAAVKRVFRREKLSGRLEILTPKPLKPAADEVLRNPRARAARLRAAERLPGGD